MVADEELLQLPVAPGDDALLAGEGRKKKREIKISSELNQSLEIAYYCTLLVRHARWCDRVECKSWIVREMQSPSSLLNVRERLVNDIISKSNGWFNYSNSSLFFCAFVTQSWIMSRVCVSFDCACARLLCRACDNLCLNLNEFCVKRFIGSVSRIENEFVHRMRLAYWYSCDLC